MRTFYIALSLLAAPLSIAQAGAIYGNVAEDEFSGITMMLAPNSDPQTLCANLHSIQSSRYEVLQLSHADNSPISVGHYFIVDRLTAANPETSPFSVAFLDVVLSNASQTSVINASHGLVTIYSGSAANNDVLVGQFVADLGASVERHEFDAEHCAVLDVGAGDR